MSHQKRFIDELAKALTEDPDVYDKNQKDSDVKAYNATSPEEAQMQPIEPDIESRDQEDKGYVGEFLSPILKTRYFADNGPLHASLQPGSESARLLLVTGDDKTSKNMATKLLNKFCGQSDINCISAGRAVGIKSISSVKNALETAKHSPGPNIVILNDPGLGLSDSYKQALGQYIIQQYKSLSANTKLVMIISHSRALIEELLQLQPAHLRLGDNYSLKDVSSGKIPAKTVQDLLKLSDSNKS